VRAAPVRFYQGLATRSSGWLPGDGRIVAEVTAREPAVRATTIEPDAAR
jgi:hypothetical protein